MVRVYTLALDGMRSPSRQFEQVADGYKVVLSRDIGMHAQMIGNTTVMISIETIMKKQMGLS